MRTHVEFRSNAFPAETGEDKQINPGQWGMALARFLRSELTVRGFPGGNPFFEDWGCCIPLDNDDFLYGLDAGTTTNCPMGFCALLSRASL